MLAGLEYCVHRSHPLYLAQTHCKEKNMCGIVGAVAQRNIVPILLEGLKRLEYRGYDSAGIAVLSRNEHLIERRRVLGKVAKLADSLEQDRIKGNTGIAHTRWATHGEPSTLNAHPHCSDNTLAIVHNGIIENHDALRAKLIEHGYQFESETDTEVIVHLLHLHLKTHDMLTALQKTVAELSGAFALGIIHHDYPEKIYAVRSGSPLVIGLGIEENFIASDPLALLPVTQRFIYLEEGDIAEIGLQTVHIIDVVGKETKRKIHTSVQSADTVSKGQYKHFMLKEIYEQPQSLSNTMEGRVINNHLAAETFGHRAKNIFPTIKRVTIIACGTSYHAGLVGKHWLESLAGIPTHVEIASENRYRKHVVEPNTLFVAISQSGETADTLAALRLAKEIGYAATLAICNAPESSLSRESDLVFLTRAGIEVGVAATKTFTTQLISLLLLTLALGETHHLDKKEKEKIVSKLSHLPTIIKNTLKLDDKIQTIAKRFANKSHALFLGRGIHHPIAMEGALKLKEISYVHAEAYPAGELKHGPLALVDKDMPVIVVAPNDHLLEKLASNVKEVQARGGELYIFSEEDSYWQPQDNLTVLHLPKAPAVLSPLVHTIPLQLLSYHIAIGKGTDVDQPRNLAKSVTVE